MRPWQSEDISFSHGFDENLGLSYLPKAGLALRGVQGTTRPDYRLRLQTTIAGPANFAAASFVWRGQLGSLMF